MSLPTPLVETDWLADRLEAEGLVVVDASWRMPGSGAARDDYLKRHIPRAVFFDIDAIADKSTMLPHMLPSPDAFARAVGALGIGSGDAVIVYDDAGLFSAARAWWTFKAMGHDGVAVLNGGLPKWIKEGRPLEEGDPRRRARTFEARLRPDFVKTSAEMRAALKKNQVVLDARPAGRFEGRDPEPRAGLRRGRMPGATSLPFAELISDGALKGDAELREIFAARDATAATPVIATCGSGVTAAVIALALAKLGREDFAVYDGSWAEWGDERNDPAAFPVVSGA